MVGPEIHLIEKTYLRFDSVTYEMPSFLKALSLLFESSLLYNINYPLESENLCYAIQYAVFKIYSESDTAAPSLTNDLNKVGLYKPPEENEDE